MAAIRTLEPGEAKSEVATAVEGFDNGHGIGPERAGAGRSGPWIGRLTASYSARNEPQP